MKTNLAVARGQMSYILELDILTSVKFWSQSPLAVATANRFPKRTNRCLLDRRPKFTFAIRCLAIFKQSCVYNTNSLHDEHVLMKSGYLLAEIKTAAHAKKLMSGSCENAPGEETL